jgi:hypothetical protein
VSAEPWVEGVAQPRIGGRTLVVGILFALVLARSTIELLGAAWAACFDADLPHRVGLNLLAWPLMTIVIGATVAVARMATRRRSRLVRVTAATLLSVGVALAFVISQVPLGSRAEAYEGLAVEFGLPSCGPGGVPTWWPSWLPNRRWFA